MLIVKDKQTGHQLQDLIKGPGNVIVLYYADWCGHCVRFKPEWAKFKSLMARKHPNICTVAEVEQSHLANVPAAQVQGYPTIKFYRPLGAPAKTANVPGFNFIASMLGGTASGTSGSNEVPFEGERTVKSLLQFVKDNRVDTPTTQPINTAAKLASLPSSPATHNKTKKHKAPVGKRGMRKKTQKSVQADALGKLAEKKGLARNVARSKEYKEGSKKYVKARAQNKNVIKQVNDAFNKMFG
jgi:thiol-disulfide isomerase/thioredoxin